MTDLFKIPKRQENFARELAILAKKYNIDRLNLTFREHTNSRDDKFDDAYVSPEYTINYSGTDGRGRPEYALSINVNATLILKVLNIHES